MQVPSKYTAAGIADCQVLFDLRRAVASMRFHSIRVIEVSGLQGLRDAQW